MMNATINEALNGFHVSIYNYKNGYKHSEICERRIDAYQIVIDKLTQLRDKELQRLQGGSYEVEV